MIISNFLLTLFIAFLDLEEYRLDMAKKLGATHTLKIEKDADNQQLADKIVSTLGEEPNKTLECSGAEQSIQVAIEVS